MATATTTGATGVAPPPQIGTVGSTSTGNMGSGMVGMINRSKARAVNGDEYEQSLENMYRQQIVDYEQNTLPIINDLKDDTTSTSIIDRSRELSADLGEKTRQTTERQLGYSMGGQLASQRKAISRSTTQGVAKARSSVMTQAHEDQRISRQAARTQLMSISEQLQQTGTASMSQAYQAKQQRDAAYKSAKSGFMTQVGALAGAAIGTVIAPGVGTAIGASIGGAAGGMVGG